MDRRAANRCRLLTGDLDAEERRKLAYESGVLTSALLGWRQ